MKKRPAKKAEKTQPLTRNPAVLRKRVERFKELLERLSNTTPEDDDPKLEADRPEK